MNTFLLDLWHDLKQKRLWPVAVVLIVATAAVPLVLSKPAEEGSEPVAPSMGEAAENPLPLVDAETIPASSDLETFDPHNPFSPDKDMPKPADDDAGSSGGSGGGGLPSTGGSGSSGGAGAASTGGSAGGSGGSPGGSGGGSGGGTFWFTFEISVKFGPVGEEKRNDGLKALDVLPDEENPVVVFMGMKDDAETALFMILDPSVEASGEGECSPSPNRCTFVALKAKSGKDEVFLNSARGDDYSLRLLKVNRVKIDEPDQEQRSSDARSSRREKNDPQPFFLPRLLSRAIGD